MNSGGSQGGSTGAVMNRQRRERAAAKLLTPSQPGQQHPLPAPVRREAMVAPWAFMVEPSRLAKAAPYSARTGQSAF